jgi:hypothetical protein
MPRTLTVNNFQGVSLQAERSLSHLNQTRERHKALIIPPSAWSSPLALQRNAITVAHTVPVTQPESLEILRWRISKPELSALMHHLYTRSSLTSVKNTSTTNNANVVLFSGSTLRLQQPQMVEGGCLLGCCAGPTSQKSDDRPALTMETTRRDVSDISRLHNRRPPWRPEISPFKPPIRKPWSVSIASIRNSACRDLKHYIHVNCDRKTI